MLSVCEDFRRSGIRIQEIYAVGNQCKVKGGKHLYIHLLCYFRLMALMVVQHRCLCSSLKGSHRGCWGAGTPCQCQRWGHGWFPFACRGARAQVAKREAAGGNGEAEL